MPIPSALADPHKVKPDSNGTKLTKFKRQEQNEYYTAILGSTDTKESKGVRPAALISVSTADFWPTELTVVS